jgi:putative FmdB family regulatory protein
MPFYEYECTNCKFYVEALQKVSEAPLKQCPSCKKQTLKKLVSAPVFRLKGGGWYETDFKSDQEGKRNLAAGEEAPPEAAAVDKPADDKAKPAEAAKDADKKPAAAAATSKPAPKKSAARPAARATKTRSKAKPKPAKRAAKRRR